MTLVCWVTEQWWMVVKPRLGCLDAFHLCKLQRRSRTVCVLQADESREKHAFLRHLFRLQKFSPSLFFWEDRQRNQSLLVTICYIPLKVNIYHKEFLQGIFIPKEVGVYLYIYLIHIYKRTFQKKKKLQNPLSCVHNGFSKKFFVINSFLMFDATHRCVKINFPCKNNYFHTIFF